MTSSQHSSNANVQSNSSVSSVSSRFALGPIDGCNPLWGYVTVIQNKKDGRGNASWRCNYRLEEHKGSYFSVKGHFLRIKKSGVYVCSKVSNDCFEEMR